MLDDRIPRVEDSLPEDREGRRCAVTALALERAQRSIEKVREIVLGEKVGQHRWVGRPHAARRQSSDQMRSLANRSVVVGHGRLHRSNVGATCARTSRTATDLPYLADHAKAKFGYLNKLAENV